MLHPHPQKLSVPNYSPRQTSCCDLLHMINRNFLLDDVHVQKLPEPKRHLLSTLALGSNGRYNRLYTVTAQVHKSAQGALVLEVARPHAVLQGAAAPAARCCLKVACIPGCDVPHANLSMQLQCSEEQLPKYKATLQSIIDSFNADVKTLI